MVCDYVAMGCPFGQLPPADSVIPLYSAARLNDELDAVRSGQQLIRLLRQADALYRYRDRRISAAPSSCLAAA